MIITDLPASEYHADHARDSHSAIEIFLRRRSDYRKYRAGTLGRRVSDEMSFGSYFHALVLEPRTARARFLVAPSRLDVGQAREDDDDAHQLCNRKLKAGKDAWEMFEAQCERDGREPVMPHDARRAAAMLEALRVHGEASELLFPKSRQPNEVTLLFDEPHTKRPSKCRLDRWPRSRRIIVDLKTYKPDTDARRPDPDRLVYQAHAFGYHRQNAWYLDAVLEETGETHSMVNVFVSNEDEPKVWTWWTEHDSTPATIGRAENLDALMAIAECERSGEWRQPFELEREQPFRLPKYAEQDAIHNGPLRLEGAGSIDG